jgi:hypothetical protein
VLLAALPAAALLAPLVGLAGLVLILAALILLGCWEPFGQVRRSHRRGGSLSIRVVPITTRRGGNLP